MFSDTVTQCIIWVTVLFCVFRSCTRATLFYLGFGTLWLVNKLNDDLRLYQGQVQLNF